MKKVLLTLLISLSVVYPSYATVNGLYVRNAYAAVPSTSGFLAENIQYDSVTGKYWWVFTNTSNGDIGALSSTSLEGPWTTTATVINDGGSVFYAPHLLKSGSTWYIYYSNTADGKVYVQSSTTVNSGYGSATVVLDKGSAGQWDDNRVSETAVYFDGTTYHMLYMGEDTALLNEKTGYATSSTPDGTFTKYASNPVRSGQSSGNDNGTDVAADPIIFPVSGGYYVGVEASLFGKNSSRVTNWYWTTDFINYTNIPGNPVLHGTQEGRPDANGAFRGDIYDDRSNSGFIYYPYTCQASASGNYSMCMGKMYLIPPTGVGKRWE